MDDLSEVVLSRDKAPLGKAVVWPKLIEYAKEHGLEIDTKLSHKVDWMEDHNGVCFCDWDSGRICPCGNIGSDFDKYNGQCLCGLLLTHKRLEMKTNNRAKYAAKKRAAEEAKKADEEKVENVGSKE